jgi:hypothetical protein
MTLSLLFRPDDSSPLDFEEDRAWFEMQRAGRTLYIAKNTVSILAKMILPVAISVWTVWWVAPSTREFVLGPVTWIALGIGTLLVGSLAAAHSWDTWRSYAKRAEIDGPTTVIDRVSQVQARVGRVTLHVAVLTTVVFALQVVSKAPVWLLAMMGVLALSAWRNALRSFRAKREYQNITKGITK